MKQHFKRMYALVAATLLAATAANAANEDKLVVTIVTDSFEVPETDISTLAVGEAKTIETGSDQVVDILRTPDGAEVYIDGELLDMDLAHIGDAHGRHVARHQVEITCKDEDDTACEQQVEILIHGDGGVSGWAEAEGDAGLHHEFEIDCIDEGVATTCEQHVIRIGDDDVIHVETVHGEHAGGTVHKVIVIEKASDTDD